MLCLWPHCCKLLAVRKREGDVLKGQQASQLSEPRQHYSGSCSSHLNLKVMLDSGSSISLLAQANVEQMTNITEKPVPKVLLRTASGIPLPVVICYSFCSCTEYGDNAT